MKLTDIFANEFSRDLLSFLKPEDDSYKERVQRHLEDRMMRMMRTRKEDNLQWKQILKGQQVLMKTWKPEPKVKVEIPSQHCQMEQMLQMTREAQVLMRRWLLRRCISLRAGVFMEGTFEAPTASTESLETSNIDNPGLHFWGKLCSNFL